MAKLITVTIVNSLPLHNLNRDETGQPKHQFDGGIKRSRLSPQALKRAARTHLRDSGLDLSVRTKMGEDEVLDAAIAYATDEGVDLDAPTRKRIKDAARKVIKGLAAKPKKGSESDSDGADSQDDDKVKDKDKDNMLFFARAEIVAYARAIVDAIVDGSKEPSSNDLIRDQRSVALDVAAFGRMFASAADRSTHAAVAVSQATTTHEMKLVTDMFSAVDDRKANDEDSADNGAGHLGIQFYTSGTYVRSFTIDAGQLARSWSMFDAPEAKDQFRQLIRALVYGLPSGRVTNSAPNTIPCLILVEPQRMRMGYGFDEAAQAGENGGYVESTVAELSRQRLKALGFDPAIFTGPATVQGDTFGHDFAANEVQNLDQVIDAIIAEVF